MSSTPPRPASSIPPLPAQLGEGQTTAIPMRCGDVLDGRYVLEEAIGEGGVGMIFRALQLRINRPVAVKFLREETLGNELLKPRFEREAVALAALQHPNIVRLQDYGVRGGLPFLAMELIEGRTLRELLKQEGALSVERTLALTRQLVHALAYAHERGIVHRDLKPLNVLVQTLPHQPEHLKVLDFGFAKFLPGYELMPGAQLTRAGITFGSPAYISPEQCAGDAIDGRADLYSVGVLMFEMLTNTPLYEGDVPELLRQHMTGPIARLSDRRAELSARPELQVFLDRALAKARDQRFANAAIFLQALDQLEARADLQLMAATTSMALAGGQRFDLPQAKLLLARLQRQLRTHGVASARAAAIASRYLAQKSNEIWHEHAQPAAARGYALARERGAILRAELVARLQAIKDRRKAARLISKASVPPPPAATPRELTQASAAAVELEPETLVDVTVRDTRTPPQGVSR